MYRLSTRQYYFVRGLVSFLLVALVILAGWYGFTRFGSETVKLNSAEKQTVSSEPAEVIIRTLNFGNMYWGGTLDEVSRTKANATSYPFSGLNTFGRQNYDSWTANLECTVTADAKSTDSQQALCPSGYVTEASKWFSLLSLASEHANDQGVSGVAFSRSSLAASGIQSFGTADANAADDICEVVAVPGRERLMDGTFKTTNFPFAYCGVSLLNGATKDVTVTQIAKYSKIMPVWVFAHMGIETTIESNQDQQEAYRSFIDAGADVVIGSHPVRVQRAEAYKGKLIMYSLGNFMTAQGLRGIEEQRGTGLAITAKIPVTQSSAEWPKLNCKDFKDSCYATATTLSLTKPKISYTYDIVTSDNSTDGVPRLASGEWNKDNLARLDWLKVKSLLTE